MLCYVRQYRDEVILCVANLSRSAQATELDLSAFKDRIPLEMLGRTRFPAIGELPYMITLAPYGFYWFELQERDKSEPVTPRDVAEFETLVVPLGATWVSLARERGVFERDVCRGIWRARRWYPERSRQGDPSDADLGRSVLRHRRQPAMARLLRDHAARRHHALHDAAADRMGALRPRALQPARAGRGAPGRARRHPARRRHQPDLHRAVAAQSAAIADGRGGEQGLRLEFRPTSRFTDKPIRQPEHIRAIEAERPDAAPSLVDNDYVVRIYRKLEAGPNPEIEMGRFLTEVAGFANTPALLGSVELVDGNSRKRGRRRSRLRRQPGRRLDRDRVLSRSLRRRAAHAGRERTPGRARGTDPLSAVTCRRPDGASPNCILRWPATASLPNSRRSRSAATTSSAGPATS